MSGPVTSSDDVPEPAEDRPEHCPVEVLDPRTASVGGFEVHRALPNRGRRMVGAWCFADQLGPGEARADGGLDVGPHPHIGLQTVTWLLEGSMLHRDSLGSEQLIRPGQLNLMTAGHGVSHSEETRDVYVGPMHGVQLWIAQPSSTRDGEPAFEHHGELPRVQLGLADATVLVGSFDGTESPARRDTEHVGIELSLRGGRTEVPLDRAFEHAVLALGSGVSVNGRSIARGQLAYLGIELETVTIDATEPVRVLLIGGEPFPEPLLMWWNYVARTRDEIVDAHRHWTAADERFGTVASPLDRIDTHGPPWA